MGNAYLMPGFRHILYPTDFSERSRAFRPLVQLVARQFQAKLTVFHAVPIPSGDYGDLAGLFPSMTDIAMLEEKIGGVLEEFFSDADATGIPEFDRETALGDPAITIADYARAEGVDLIMMTTHGRGRFRNLLMGSVASKVLHDAECPVWTATHAEDPALLRDLGIRGILAALDLAPDPIPDQVDVVCRSAELGRQFGATVRLLHAVPSAEHTAGDTGGGEFAGFLLRSAREQIEKVQREAGTNFEVLVRPGSVAQAIRGAALETQADLVVMGRGRVREAFGRLLSRTYDIIGLAPCPVLSL
jgi:nucleotide-binding universal stress UspA family protein